MPRYIIGDTETTGLGPTRKACEIALMEIDPDTLEEIGRAHSVINPEKLIDPTAAAIHGITDEEAALAPTAAQFVEKELHGGLEGEIVVIGYRVAFDRPMLECIGNVVAWWDLLPLAQTLVEDSANHQLQTMREYFNLPGGDAHRAMGDVQTTQQLLQQLIPMSGRSLEAHCSTRFMVIHKMPWGKHAGEPLITLPFKYKQWLLSLPELDHNLKRSLEMFAKTDKII